MRAPILLAALLTLASTFAPGAGAADRVEGSLILSPDGLAGSSYEATFEELGLTPPAEGDALRLVWDANGGAGPAIYFEVHSHDTGYVRHFEATAVSLNETWPVPNSDLEYWPLWRNPSGDVVHVNYTFAVERAPGGAADGPFPWFLLSIALAVAAAAAVLLWRRSRRGRVR